MQPKWDGWYLCELLQGSQGSTCMCIESFDCVYAHTAIPLEVCSDATADKGLTACSLISASMAAYVQFVQVRQVLSRVLLAHLLKECQKI